MWLLHSLIEQYKLRRWLKEQRRDRVDHSVLPHYLQSEVEGLQSAPTKAMIKGRHQAVATNVAPAAPVKAKVAFSNRASS